MAPFNFDSLPAEIVIEIIETALGNPGGSFCKVGHNGIWSQPRPGGLDLMLQQPSRPHTPLGDTLPFPDGNHNIWEEESDTHTSDDDDQEAVDFYSTAKTLRLWVEFESFSGVGKLIKMLSDSQLARVQLKHLDLALASVPLKAYDRIRSNFPNIESLNVRNGSYKLPGRVWVPEEASKWASYGRLTRLQFYWCRNLYAPHVPGLVKLFPALRELLVSSCGDPSDEVMGPLRWDWYLDPEALCKTHIPLEYCHVEHMDDWEIRALGVIPAKTWIVTTIKPPHFLQELSNDDHIFPGITHLQIESESWPTVEKPASVITLEELCKKRGVKLTRDAKPVHSAGFVSGRCPELEFSKTPAPILSQSASRLFGRTCLLLPTTMSSVNSLPIELFIPIITAVLDTSSRDEFPKVGHNAAWRKQKPSPLEIMAIQHSRPHTPVEGILPFPDGVDNEANSQKSSISNHLSRVNRAFNQIATALLFRDVNLLYGIENIPKVERILKEMVLPHANHIRSLWIYADTTHEHLIEELDTFTANLLRSCPRLESLGLYFHWNMIDQEWSEGWVTGLTFWIVHRFIESVAQSERARSHLKSLDVAGVSVTLETRDLICSRFPNL
ncbi:9507_t:CDS:2, partial [Acaulospora colombiana]